MILGVVGKIAVGKSTVLDILKKKGFYCIDADKLVHELYKNGKEGQVLVKEYFGEKYLLSNGDVDREKLAELVFEKKSKLLLLNRLIHPCVAKEVKVLIEKAEKTYENIAVEAVYFDEKYLGGIVDKILLIERDFELAKDVLIGERGLGFDVAKKIYDTVTLPNKVDFVIKNNGTLKDLENELLKIL
jgi:dephospho-CoA kinase